MGLAIHLQDERGAVRAFVLDTQDLLHRQLTMTNDGILGGIDWYGDTTFNRLQMRQFIPAWEALIGNAIDPDEEALLTGILALANESLKDVHQYTKFVGD